MRIGSLNNNPSGIHIQKRNSQLINSSCSDYGANLKDLDKDTIELSNPFTDDAADRKEAAAKLKQELLETKKTQGLVGKIWDGAKNILHLKASSKNVEKIIKKFEEGTITQEEADIALAKYKKGQEMSVDVFADMVSGFIAIGATMAAPFTGGTSLMLAAGIGTVAKPAIKGIDAAVGGRKYKTLGYDIITGFTNGLMAPFTNALGGAAGTGVAKLFGLNVVKSLGREAVEAGAKTAGKSFLTRLLAKQGAEYIAKNGAKKGIGLVAARVAAYATDMAVNGSVSGAADAFARSIATGDFKNLWKNVKQGFIGGMIAAPLIGGGFRLAGKAGSTALTRINNKLTIAKILPDGTKTKFAQGETGDCALLSIFDGLLGNDKTAKQIRKSIVTDANGDYLISIGKQIFKVTKDSLSDEALADKTGVRIFEQLYKQIAGSDALNGGYADVIAKRMGLNPIHMDVSSLSDEVLQRASREIDAGNSILSLGMKINSDGVIDGNGTIQHYFSIKKIDPVRRSMTVTDTFDTSKHITLSFDDIKHSGVSIDGGSIKKADLPNTVRSSQAKKFFGRKASQDTSIVDASQMDEIIAIRQRYYDKAPHYKRAEMLELLETLSEEPKYKPLIDRIKASGDLFSDEDITKMIDLIDNLEGQYTIEQLIRTRGNCNTLNAQAVPVASLDRQEAAQALRDYVLAMQKFYSKDDAQVRLSIEKIKALINQMPADMKGTRTLYRGVLSDDEIARLFSLLEKKMEHPELPVIYEPGRLTSVTRNLDVTKKTYGQKCMMYIDVPQELPAGTANAIDVNSVFKTLRLGENKFAFQEELLFHNDVRFELKSMRIINGTPTFFVQLTGK